MFEVVVTGEAVRTLRQDIPDLVCREAPRLIADPEEYPEASIAGLRITRLRGQEVRGRGTGEYCYQILLWRECSWLFG